jgi:hypothetical protein
VHGLLAAARGEEQSAESYVLATLDAFVTFVTFVYPYWPARAQTDWRDGSSTLAGRPMPRR